MISKRRRPLWAHSAFWAAILLLAIVWPGPTVRSVEAAEDKPTGPAATFEFSEVAATDVLSALGELYGVTFRATTTIARPISLSSQGKIDLAAALTLLEVSLAEQDLDVIREGDVIKIAPRGGGCWTPGLR